MTYFFFILLIYSGSFQLVYIKDNLGLCFNTGYSIPCLLFDSWLTYNDSYSVQFCANWANWMEGIQWNLSWETTALRDHLLTDHIFLAEGPTFHYKWTCHQRSHVLTDHIFVANGVVFQDMFHCTWIALLKFCDNSSYVFCFLQKLKKKNFFL